MLVGGAGAPPHGHLLGGNYFRNKDGLYIHYRSWSSPSARASAWDSVAARSACP